jgi:hypothetical protein
MTREQSMTSVQDDMATVAALDTAYQAAVESDDVETMDRILADDFVLVTGSGKVFNNTDLLEEARGDRMVYEVQCDGEPFEYRLWFSDTYIRTPSGWKYVFAQASLPLPASS